MAVVEHQPPNMIEIPRLEPAVFLAGPIKGARDWQQEAGTILAELWKPTVALHVINPRWDIDPDTFIKNNQITWEKAGLRRSAILGGMAFFLARESENAPAPNNPGRAYAQTTRQEFGRAVGWKDYDSAVAISLGMEDGYKGSEDYYRHTAGEIGLTVHQSLQDTCEEIVDKVDWAYKRAVNG